MSNRTRHWKQRWDPSAEFIFAKRMRMGDDPKNPFVLPGQKVTKAIREKIGLVRLRRWWEAGVISLADWEPARQNRRGGAQEPHKRKSGGGWYEVTLPGEDAQKVRGEEAADELIEAWRARQEEPEPESDERVNDAPEGNGEESDPPEGEEEPESSEEESESDETDRADSDEEEPTEGESTEDTTDRASDEGETEPAE